MDHDHVGFVSRDGSFSIHNVAVGTYILHVISPKLSYVPIRIDVGNQGTCNFKSSCIGSKTLGTIKCFGSGNYFQHNF